MRVLFDGYWWASGPISNRTVMREFISSWHDTFPEDELHVLVPWRADITTDTSPGLIFHRTRLPLQALINGLALPAVAKRISADLTVAHNFSPAFGKSAVFIHDLMFVDHPEWFTVPENAYFRLMTLGARRATHLYTSSAAESQRITRVTGHPSVTPIGLGMSRDLIEADSRRPARLNVREQAFQLVVGRLNVRKNLSKTIEALVSKGIISKNNPMVVVGETSGREAADNIAVTEAIRNGSVLLMGSVASDELRWLYENCSCFIFMSLDEGFGLPCLESRVFRAPAAVSDIPPFREILGDDAEYADPESELAIADAVAQAGSRGRRGNGIDHSLTEQYSWESCVRGIRRAFVGV